MQTKQAKLQNPKPVAESAADSTRLPAWSNAWGDQPPAGLVGSVAELQAKHILSQPADPHEQEADQIADQVKRLTAVGSSMVSAPPDAPEASPLRVASVSHIPAMIQRAPLDDNAASLSATTESPSTGDTTTPETSSPALIVDDSAEQLAPGQMKKSDFLAQLRDAVCTTVEEALKGTMWSAIGCPWVDHWFGYYSNRSGQQIERAIRKYAPDTAVVTSASDYVPLICDRVRKAIATWSTTGKVTGVPEGVSTALPGTPNAFSTGTASATQGAKPETGKVQLKANEGSTGKTGDPQAIREQLGAGSSIGGNVKSQMESAFGMDFSHVRVHTDTMAMALSSDLHARAFTVGEHVAFGSGEYQPGTPVGDALIAHELAHVVQQRGADALTAPQQKGENGYDALEEDADMSAVGAVVSLWSGAKVGLANIAQNAVPRLQSGLKLQRCSPSSPTELTEEQKQKLFVEATKKQFPTDLDKQIKDIDIDLRTSESRALQLRMKAVEMKLLPPNVPDAWYTAQTLILTSGSSLRSGKGDDATKATIKKAIGDFYTAFRAVVAPLDVFKERAPRGKFGSYDVYENKYLDPRTYYRVQQNLQDATSASDWLDVFSDFRMVSGGMDLYIASKFREQARQEEIGNFKDASQKAQVVVDTMKDALKRGTPDETPRVTTVQTLEALYTNFRKAVAPYDYEAERATKVAVTKWIANPYYLTENILAGLLKDLRVARSEAEWVQVFAGFEEVRKGIDQYIAAGPQILGRSQEAETLVFQGALAPGIAALLEKHPEAEKVQAMFYPEIQKENVAQPDFQVKGIPLYFYLYREDDEWNLVDLTTPHQEKANSASGGTETKPPVKDLFKQLNSKLRFPKGILYWRMRDGTDWTMPTTEPIRVSEWLSWIGLGVAAIGLTLATFGTGTVALVGAWFLAGSAVASGASAAADIVERSKQGMLDTETAIIDVSQIVASLASIGSFAAERIVTRAIAAAEANAPFTGTKASIAVLSQRLYVPLVGTRLAADTVSFIVMTDELFKQMIDIQSSTTMEQREKDRLKTMI